MAELQSGHFGVLKVDNILQVKVADIWFASFARAARPPPDPPISRLKRCPALKLQVGQKSCKLDPGSRSALNIEIGGSGGRAPDAHPHNFAQRSKDVCKFYLQNIVLLPTGKFRLPDESRPLAPPAVRAGGGRDLQHAPK